MLTASWLVTVVASHTSIVPLRRPDSTWQPAPPEASQQECGLQADSGFKANEACPWYVAQRFLYKLLQVELNVPVNGKRRNKWHATYVPVWQQVGIPPPKSRIRVHETI
jgi:hypothetical protein